MNKLVYGVGVNDLGYRTQVFEYVTEDGGRKVRKPVFICKYYVAWTNMLKRCYSKNTWKENQAILALASATSGCPLQHSKSGWRSKTGMASAWTRTLLFQETSSIPLKHVRLCRMKPTCLLLHAMRVEGITQLVYVFIKVQANIKPVVETLSAERMNT